MANIYAGNVSKVDAEILRAVEKLPDDFWIFAEFDIDRNVDWLAIREVPPSERGLRPSTLILTELKRSDRPIRAWNMNGPWDKLDDSGVYVEVHTDKPEINYYQQVLHTSSALQEWLWRNQRFYLDDTASVQPIDSFKPWPDLLIVSPPGVRHQLPIRPPTGYGGFWFGIDQWIGHVQRWNPRAGYSWTRNELEQLAQLLGLMRLNTPRITLAPAAGDAAPKELADFFGWLARLEERVVQLEQRLQAMGGQPGNGAYAQVPSTLPPVGGSFGSFGIPQDIPYSIGQQFDGIIYRISPQKDYVLASLPDGYTVLLHISKMSDAFQRKLNWDEVQIGDAVRLEIIHIERDRERGNLRLEVRDISKQAAAVQQGASGEADEHDDDEASQPATW